jgi:renalase
VHIAIIGAGIAGLTAANRLVEAGATCTVFDKSRGVGGRMATRCIGTLAFDHGAQYITARGAPFRALLQRWQAEGAVGEWLPGKWVGVPGMTAPAHALARSVHVVPECRITGIVGKPGRWRLTADAASTGLPAQTTYDAVVLAIPSPQSAPLLASIGNGFPELGRVRYAPCLTLMLAFETAIAMPTPFETPTSGPLGWIARNTSKPGRADTAETVVVQATPEWSRTRIDASAEDVTKALLHGAHAYVGPATPTVCTLQRWLYARVEQAAGVPCLWDRVQRVGACGDWALGARVECAFDSGAALASAIIDTAL